MTVTEQSTFDYLHGQVADSGAYIYIVQNTGPSAYSDIRLLDLRRLASVDALYNATGWQAQLLQQTGLAAGPVRQTAADLNADILSLWNSVGLNFYVVRVTLTRIDAADVAGANFTFTKVS